MNLRRVWDTQGRPSKPQFQVSGLALDHIQFSYRNVTGMGAKTKRKAVINWIKQVSKELQWRSEKNQ